MRCLVHESEQIANGLHVGHPLLIQFSSNSVLEHEDNLDNLQAVQPKVAEPAVLIKIKAPRYRATGLAMYQLGYDRERDQMTALQSAQW